LSYSPMCFPV